MNLVVEAASISTKDKSRLTSLLQSQQENKDGDDTDTFGAPDPAAYENKSGGILDVLGDLLEKSQGQLAEARKAEAKSKNNYELLKLELTDSIKFENQELEKSKKRKAEAEEVKATSEGELAVTTKELAEDMVRLSDVHHDCMTKASDFEIEVQARGEELKVLATAKKIIIEKVGGAFDQTYTSDQESFLQISSRARTTVRDASGLEAVKIVRRLARQQKSAALAQLADRMAAVARLGATSGEDPFAKVKGLITEMIEKLLKEAEEEAAKKNTATRK